jgi:toxin ParE1/3/4
VSGFRLTPAAQRDLSSIWDFTEKHWDIRQAEKYIREIRHAIERVAADPDRGRSRDEIRVGYRSYAVGSHAVFSTVRAGGVDVIRILHHRMDLSRRL